MLGFVIEDADELDVVTVFIPEGAQKIEVAAAVAAK